MQPQHSICNITDPGGQRRLALCLLRSSMNSLAKAGLLCCLLCGSLAHAAGINIGTTRVIFHGDAKDASISISNSDNVPYLIQSRAQSISETGASGDAPFMVTRRFFALMAGKRTYCELSVPAAICRKIASRCTGWILNRFPAVIRTINTTRSCWPLKRNLS